MFSPLTMKKLSTSKLYFLYIIALIPLSQSANQESFSSHYSLTSSRNEVFERHLKESDEPWSKLMNILEDVPPDQKSPDSLSSPDKYNTSDMTITQSKNHTNTTNTTATTKNETTTTTHTEEASIYHLTFDRGSKDIYDIFLFLALACIFGKISEQLSFPSLVGEIICGMLLGPGLANFIPQPQSLILLGQAGFVMLNVEVGVNLDLAGVQMSGIRAFVVSITGSILALVTGAALAYMVGIKGKRAIMFGAVFAPSSLSVASAGLKINGVNNTMTGKLVLAATVLDNVIGLVILPMLQVLAKDNPHPLELFIPLFSSFSFLIIVGYSALTWMPKMIENRILVNFESEEQKTTVCLSLMMLLLLVYMPLMHYCDAGIFTGAFLAGLTFSQIEIASRGFHANTFQIMEWLLRIFFTAGIGFLVPTRTILNPNVITQGILFYFAVMSKFPVGCLVPTDEEIVPIEYPFRPFVRDMLIAGFAMTCRGEFNMMIAAFLLGEGIFEEEEYAAVVFALLLSCVTSLIFLNMTTEHYKNEVKNYIENSKDKNDGQDPLYLFIELRNQNKWSILKKLQSIPNMLGLCIIDAKQWYPKGLDTILATEMYVQDTKTLLRVAAVASDDEEHDEQTREDEEDPFLSDDVDLLITNRIKEVEEAFLSVLEDPNSTVQVQQWCIGTKDKLQQSSIVEQVKDETNKSKKEVYSDNGIFFFFSNSTVNVQLWDIGTKDELQQSFIAEQEKDETNKSKQEDYSVTENFLEDPNSTVKVQQSDIDTKDKLQHLSIAEEGKLFETNESKQEVYSETENLMENPDLRQSALVDDHVPVKAEHPSV